MAASSSQQFDFQHLKGNIHDFMCSTQLNDEPSATKFQELLASTPGSDGEKMTCVDLSFRDGLKEFMMENSEIKEIVPLLDFTLQAIAKESCPLGTIFSMLMDLADCSTIAQCEELFTFVEAKMSKWKTEPFFTKGKNHLLRICNDILKKLSKSQNTVFCGRIQLFLARLFPLTEKSGLNLLSEFNLDNLTVFSSSSPSADTVELPPEKQAEQMDVDELGLSLARDAPVDYAFYTKFWSLQEFFREPILCYTKVSWKKFSTYADTVLATFQSLKLDDPRVKRQKQKLQAVRAVKDQHTFFAKYLTSDKLFNLQLSDSNFRRYVLVQFLILFQYLTSHVKFRNTSAVLNDEQQKWVTKTKQMVIELIHETPDGEQFAQTVQRVLEMESCWNNWKNEQCPSFVKRSDPKETRTRIIVRKRSMIDDLNITDPKVFNLGNAELNNLWNQHADNDVIIRSESRQFVPALDQYFDDAIMAADPKNQIEDAYKDVHNPGWQWRALRLLSKKSRHLFEQTQTPARKIPDYLEDIMRKLAKEITPSTDQSIQQPAEEDVSIQAGQMQEEEDIEVEAEEASPTNDTSKSTPTPDLAQTIADDLPEASLLRSLVSNDQLTAIADLVSSSWERLAKKFTALDEDDLNYFREKETPAAQATNMLTVWKEMGNKEATVEKMATALKEADLSGVAVRVFGSSVYS